ncbi:hypothetical protein BDR04DRAFT_467969 [Suillus decipiens]|nr:hypothetical protein BDR04DRAFT_467969 [Suillus decipiens]
MHIAIYSHGFQLRSEQCWWWASCHVLPCSNLICIHSCVSVSVNKELNGTMQITYLT